MRRLRRAPANRPAAPSSRCRITVVGSPARRGGRLLVIALAVACGGVPAGAAAQERITTPREQFGHDFGADYFLANYQQIAEYWQRLARESERLALREIGRTSEGRPHYMAIVTSPANHRELERYRGIARRLALAEGLTDEEARALAREGKAVVWIDGGLHANETLGAQQLGEMVYRMVSGTDAETMRILDDVIILFVHANPDGNDLVTDWYMRNPVPEERSAANLPRLYHKYIGHDNNRDFFASTQVETENMNRVLYHEWFPQLLYNHHQSGPAGTVVWSPPLRDPYNYNLHPMLVLGFQSLGAAMHTRLAAENKPGATMRSGGPYDGWWNGGIRNTAAFHNTIAVLTEMIGNPTPMRIPLVLARQLPSADLAFPVAPQAWHFRQSVEYSISLNRAVLDYGSRMRENLLYNIHVMGRHSIERGGQDSWTANPRRIAAAAQQAGTGGGRGGRGAGAGRGGGGGSAGMDEVWADLRRPEYRDPRGFIIPSDQPDFPTATKFINALRETNIRVERAVGEFEVEGKVYPAGSYVVRTAQAYRPHVLDMFEPQVHPDVFPYPGAPPTPPYDNAGWTLAFTMGVEFDRVLEGFDGPFEPITEWNVAPPAGRVTGAEGAAGFLTRRDVNDAVIALNRLLAAGAEVYALSSPLQAGGAVFPAGTLYVRATPATRAAVPDLARDLGLHFTGVRAAVPGDAERLARRRIGLWDRYGGSMDSGWARWILEQFEVPFDVVLAERLEAGGLDRDFDALIFVGGGIPTGADATIPQLRTFMEAGGTVIAIGLSAQNLAVQLELPLENHLEVDGTPLPRTRYYVPGSVLNARVDTAHAAARGMKARTDFFFDASPVFRLGAGARAAGITPIAWFDSAAPLRSGWAWGQEHLDGGVIAVEARIGRGRALLFTPEILKRAQPHGTFKLLFNGIQHGMPFGADPSSEVR